MAGQVPDIAVVPRRFYDLALAMATLYSAPAKSKQKVPAERSFVKVLVNHTSLPAVKAASPSGVEAINRVSMTVRSKTGTKIRALLAIEPMRGLFPAVLLMVLFLYLAFFTGFQSPVLAADGAPASVAALSYKMAGDAARVRLVMQFDREPAVRWFLLRGPHRLVIDLEGARFSIDPDTTSARGLVKDVRYGSIDSATARLILTMDGPVLVETFDVIENESSPGYRLVADLVATSDKQFEAALADQVTTTGSTRSTPKGDRVISDTSNSGKRFTIVIDPGHGGIDSGAEGGSGTLEKDVTLTFARELKKRLEANRHFLVQMTRNEDTFLRLDERVRIARQHGANLFISVHADTIRYKSVRGATVYTVSDQASDAEAAALATRENLSDELAGMEIEDENHQVADILMDLIRRETHSFSVRFARSLVGSLTDTVELIKNPHRHAGFRVLKAPDVPSVLLELGYLSNSKDEEQLLDPDWRAKAIDSVSEAINGFAGAEATTGG